MHSLLKFALVAGFGLAVVACDSADPVVASGANGSQQAKATKDWTAVVAETPDGGFLMGNPDAKVKLVEYGSFTCSHCRDFHVDAVAHLEPEFIKTGRVSYEFRPFMLNIYDFAVSQLAMCQGASKFFRWSDELYNNQESWVEPFAKLKESDVKALQNLPLGQQILGLAKAGELDQFAARRGVPGAQFDGCLGNEAAIEATAKRQQEAVKTYKIEGTPTFLLNGKKVDNTTTWGQLQPQIAKALS